MSVPITVKHVLTILLVSSAVMLIGLGTPRLWDRDEPRNADCARGMLERGDWIVPMFNGELRAHKPVLLYWCMMAAYSLGGVSEFTARLPSALCAIGSALATYFIGRRLFNRTIGLWSGIILSTSLMFGVAGRAATPDSLLIFCVALTMLVYVWFAFPSQDGSCFPRRLWPAALLYGAMGLAVLAKGPVGFVLPTAIIGMFLLIQRLPAKEASGESAGVFIKMLRPFAPRHFLQTCLAMRPLSAIGMVLLVAAPWYIAIGIMTDGAFLHEFFVTHNLDRATGSMEGHRGGPWYYPVAMLVGFFPWSIFVLPLLIETFNRLRARDKYADGYLFATCWICVWVGIFSLARTKLPSYVTPCYPALALLAGCFVHHVQQGTLHVHPYWLPASLVTLMGVGVGILVGVPIAAEKYLPGEGWLGMLGIVPVSAAVVAAICWYKNKMSWPAPLVAAAGGIVEVGILALGASRADLHRHDQQMVVALAESSTTDRPVAAYRVLEPSWIFYSHQTIPELLGEPATAARLLEDQPNAVLITKEQMVPGIRREMEGEVLIVESAPHFLRGERLVVLRRKMSLNSMGTGRTAQGKRSAH